MRVFKLDGLLRKRFNHTVICKITILVLHSRLNYAKSDLTHVFLLLNYISFRQPTPTLPYAALSFLGIRRLEFISGHRDREPPINERKSSQGTDHSHILDISGIDKEEPDQQEQDSVDNI